MPPIRNSRVASGQLSPATTTIVYTVPAQTVLLLKYIAIWNSGSTPGQAWVQLVDSAGAGALRLFDLTLPANNVQQWSSWTALNAGDYVVAYAASSSCFYWLAGALLPFVPGF